MLVTPRLVPLDELTAELLRIASGRTVLNEPSSPSVGVFVVSHFSGEELLPRGQRRPFAYMYPFETSYGVCDSWEQVLSAEPRLKTDLRPFVIFLTEVRKADQPEDGGWRWHKWGPYIGRGTPTTEYLHDEPLFECVFVYHIVQLFDDESETEGDKQ